MPNSCFQKRFHLGRGSSTERRKSKHIVGEDLEELLREQAKAMADRA